MSLVGIFSRSRPSIHGMYFDALLEESSELITDISEYPIETGQSGNDNAVNRPLRITMTVALSDNPIKALLAAASLPDVVSIDAGPAVGVAVGVVTSALPGAAAAIAGIGRTVAGAYLPGLVGSGELRSSGMIKAIRDIQETNQIITVIGAKQTYQNVMITNTRVQITKQNEGGLELVVEMRKLVIVNSQGNEQVQGSPPAGDTAATQAQPEVDYGEIGSQ